MTQSPLGTILFVCTSHAELGESGSPTGFWMEELAAPYFVFREAGFDTEIASPKGGQPPVDPGSLSAEMKGHLVDWFEADSEAMSKLAASKLLDSIDKMDAYAGIFLVGGHGTMWDFPQNRDIARLVELANAQGKAIGAVCHGVAGLLAGNLPNLLNGRAVAGFSNAEEAAVGLTEVVPMLLETELVKAGFDYSSAAAFAPHVVTDGLLITGQNPTSSMATAKAMTAFLTRAQ